MFNFDNYDTFAYFMHESTKACIVFLTFAELVLANKQFI